MPKVRWGISAADVDQFDRERQYTPYAGPIPPNGVYRWKIKVLKHIAGTKEKFPQLRIGLELVPRPGRDEKKYKGYFIMAFPPVSENTDFRYVPFLDAIGVSGREFAAQTMTDEDGNIRKIGRWRNTGDVHIAAEQKDGTDQNGNPRKEVGWMGPDPGNAKDEDDDDDEYEDELDDEEYDEDEDLDWDDD